MNQVASTPSPKNEPVLAYAPGSAERSLLKSKLREMADSAIEIPLVIGGKETKSGKLGECACPHDHRHLLAKYHKGSKSHVASAIEAARGAYHEWSTAPWERRAAVFLKAADLLATSYRPILNAATMLCQSKNAFQAEIDSACELIDFWRFNVAYARRIDEMQPESAAGMWNRMEYRPLEGFVFAVTPFNFTSIAGNLPTAPAIMGNTVVWKPASTAVYSAWFIMRLLKEAGLPDGVINMVPGSGAEVGPAAMDDPGLAGIHFTGSTEVFHDMWKHVGSNISRYRNYPRIVGETGGKDFVFAHPSTDPSALTTALIRGAFEYQGQKCSAASRAYIPTSVWPKMRDRLVEDARAVAMGGVMDFRNFMNAVIDASSFKRIKAYIDEAKKSPEASILCGGECDDRAGYFIRPTIIVATNPRYRTMEEEIFGPVLTVYVYDDAKFEETLRLCDATSPYALTGAIFATDRAAIDRAAAVLRHAAGNFYVNDKPTGAVVGQQPFGGSRASGTNDKAGSVLNLIRWVTPRTIKENFVPPTDYRYPFMREE